VGKGFVGIAVGLIEECDELGADDGTGSILLGGLERLAIADAEANHAGIAEVHGVDAAEVGLLGVVEGLLGAGDGGRRDHVDEAVGVLVDEADAFFAGLGRDEHDDSKVVAVGDGLDEVLVIVERQVGDNHAADATLDTTLTKGLDAVVENGIEIAHEDDGDVHVVLDGLQLGEKFGKRHTIFEGLSGGALDNGTIGQRVAEGDADLDEIDAATLHGEDDVTCAFECGTASTEIE